MEEKLFLLHNTMEGYILNICVDKTCVRKAYPVGDLNE